MRGKCITDQCYEDVNNAYERALVFLHKVISIVLFLCVFVVSKFLFGGNKLCLKYSEPSCSI